MAFQGGKTTMFEGGLRVPFVVRDPYQEDCGVRCAAPISHVDITPSLIDWGGNLDPAKNSPKTWRSAKEIFGEMGDGVLDFIGKENTSGGQKYTSYHGQSWVPLLTKEDDPERGTIFASHTFHEIQMYYPMRVIRDRDYKLTWNIASGLPYPSASDLWSSSMWQAQWEKGEDAPYGKMTVGSYMNRPPFELYDMKAAPWEGTNLADSPEHAEILQN